jgi:hypothetical protein
MYCLIVDKTLYKLISYFDGHLIFNADEFICIILRFIPSLAWWFSFFISVSLLLTSLIKAGFDHVH